MEDASRFVLVVEDEPLFREVTVMVLEDAGYAVAKAADGEVAIEQLDRGRRPDLVVLDINMPKVNGWGVLAHIHALARPMPVVIMTGLDEVVPPGDLGRHVSGCLLKPFTTDLLLHACQKALAAPPLVVALGGRKEVRRTFAVETILMSDGGTPIIRGKLVQVSLHGFQLEMATPLNPGDSVRVAFALPGRLEPVLLSGRVRWRSQAALGAEIERLEPQQEQVLRELIGI
jgi:CheY-like chemotaxis protein